MKTFKFIIFCFIMLSISCNPEPAQKPPQEKNKKADNKNEIIEKNSTQNKKQEIINPQINTTLNNSDSINEVDKISKVPVAYIKPENFTLLNEATGNLDKNTGIEKVIVYDTGREVEMGTEREIHILKKIDGTWTLWHKSVGPVLPSLHGGMMGDPFDNIKIERKCIVITHFGGSRHKWAYTHRYRYQKKGWFLVGATVESGIECENWEIFDYNVSNGKIEVVLKEENCEEKSAETEDKKSSYRERLKELPQMDGFYPGNNEVKIHKIDKTFYF